MTTATLTRWGNSQGITIPKKLCEQMNIHVGDRLELTYADNTINITATRHTGRTRKLTIDDIFADYNGHYQPPADYPTIGNEIDWGTPQGKETIR